MASIKDYIKSSKDYSSKLNISNTKDEANLAVIKQRSSAFILENINQNLDEIETSITEDITAVDDKALKQMKEDSSNIPKRLEKISEKYEQLLLQPITEGNVLHQIQVIVMKYIKLNALKMRFIDDVNKEYLSRELDKDQSNKHINIKLNKFSGYESSIDYYTFRTNFEKLHLETTPTRFLPDLLKNNYLSDPALTLVRSLTTVDEIWERLKSAYGDTKMMLSRKLQTLFKVDIKSRDPQKLVIALSKYTNTIREVMLLAHQYRIEENLYYGDSLQKIYQQLGDSRLTRFLSSIADEEPTVRKTWEKLLTFLEKEEKLNQQKIVIHGHQGEKNEASSNQHHRPPKASARSYNNYPNTNEPASCKLCGKSSSSTEHVSSFGPGGTRIVQYYTCKDFAMKNPAVCLALLKEKGFCFQCLLHGADSSCGKHLDGNCQREYACPHPSHNIYPVKKHVLVCEEHKNHPDNKQVLEKFFKARCLRSFNLPDFAKQIQLTFHSSSYPSLILSPKDSIAEKGAYLLQSIMVNGNTMNIFYDNGCSDFIVSSKGVQLLGSSAYKFDNQPILLKGVGESVISSLGSYHVSLPLYNGEIVTLSGLCLKEVTSTFPIFP